ncbi:aminotransferase-like mobile domain-containing protein [Tanacetum coccineum]
MKTSLSLQSEPGIYTEWSSTDTHKMHYLTIPSDFEGHSSLFSLSVCIRECISSQFEVEAEETEEVFGNEDNGNANGALQAVLADPGILDCSICHESYVRMGIWHVACAAPSVRRAIQRAPGAAPSLKEKWSKDTPRKCKLTVPSWVLRITTGLLSLSVCIKKKVIPSEFEEEMKEARLPAALCNSLTRSHWFIKGLENIFKSVIVPCKNNGCNMAMLLRYQNEHEQVCPHATCFCPYPSCPFTGSHENLYLHFGLKHEADITVSPSPHPLRPTLFLLCWAINQEYLFLQEEQASVIFILNHQVQLHERVINELSFSSLLIVVTGTICRLDIGTYDNILGSYLLEMS